MMRFFYRAGSGHYSYGPGRVSGLWFWPGSGSGYWKTPTGWFRAKKAKETKIRANFGLISGQLRAITVELIFNAKMYFQGHQTRGGSRGICPTNNS